MDEPIDAACVECGATFPHAEAKTPTKGVLACPICGSTGALERIDDPGESAG
jgi:predicted Zn-ribbon and HTH transcriptional regulator